MLELLDIAILGLLMFFSTLSAAFVAFKIAKPRLLGMIKGAGLAIGNQVTKGLSDVVENIDVGEVLGQLGGGEDGPEGLGALTSMVGGKGGGIVEMLGALVKMGGKGNQGGGSSGW